MITVNCAVCGSPESDSVWIKQGATYVRCKACRLVYENPRLTESELKEYYSKESYYFSPNEGEETSGYQDYFTECSPAHWKMYFDVVEKYAGKAQGQYLDVGCGTGGLLKVAQTRGWKSLGVEISRWAIETGRKDGLEILEGSLQDLGLPGDSFQAISMFDVLEHVTAPRELMQEVYRVLKPGGTMIAETPNVNGFFVTHLYREDADLVKPRAHICLYSPDSARRLMEKSGFSTYSISTFPYCRRFTPGYFKRLLISRILPKRKPVQLTWNESLRIIASK